MLEMDYHSLPRKQLQALCKKHDIPANQTNVQMADALATLLKAEGKAKSDANAGRTQSVRVESGKEKSVVTMNSNVLKASTRSNKEAVKSAEEGCEEHVASAEDVESNEGAKAGKTRGRGLPKLVPESKEHKDEIGGTSRKHCRLTQRERTCKNSDSDFSIVDVTSKKIDKKKTSASEDEAVDGKARENIEERQSLKVEETLQVQENSGKHMRHLRKKTMPEEQTKLKLVDVGIKRTRAGKATQHPAVATELSVKDVDGEEENATNKFGSSCENRAKKAQETGELPVIIDIVDSDDEEVVKDLANEKADIVDVSVEPTMNASESLKPVITGNGPESPKRVVTRKGHKGGHKKEVLKSSSEEVKINAVCISVEPSSNSSECLKKVVTLRGKKEEKVVTASFEEGKVDTVDVSDEPAVKQRGCKGGKKEELIVTNSIDEAKNIVTDVPVEATVNASGSPKQVITRKGRKAEHINEVLKTSSEEDKVNAVCVSVEPTSSSLECMKQIVTRRRQKFSHKEEKVVNASSEEDKADVDDISDEPAVNQRGRKGGKKEELIVTISVEEAKNIVTDVPVEATVNASESPKGVVTRKGRKGEHRKEVLKTDSEEDKVNAVCVSVEPTSSSLECLKQVVTRRGQKCSRKEEKVVNASSKEDKVDVLDEPTVNRRGRKGGQKKESILTDSAEEAKNIRTDVPAEVTVNVSKSPKRVVTRKGHKGEHKNGEVLEANSEENKVNAVCVSVEPTLNSSECLKQVVTQRGEKCGQELLVTDSIEEAKNNTTNISVEGNVSASESPKSLVTSQGCKVVPVKVLYASAEESKVNPVSIPVKLNVNCSETPKHVVTRRGRINKQEGRKVVTVNPSECLKQIVTRRGEKCSQEELLVTDSIEEAKNNSTDISGEDNTNASESPKRVVTRQGCKAGHGKVMNASAKESKVDPVKFTENCTEIPKLVVTRRGRINRQEEVLETNIVEEAKNNVADISVEASLNFEDDASVDVAGNPFTEHVTQEGQKSWLKEELVNASHEENKGDADAKGESSSEEDESDGKEKKADFRNLNDKNYSSKIKTRRTQQRQKPGKNLPQNKGELMEENNSVEKQKQISSGTDGVRQMTITRRGLQRKATYGKPDIRKNNQQEGLVQTEGHIDGGLHSSTLGSYCLHEAEAGEIVREIVDGNKQSSSTEVAGNTGFDVDNLNESLESIKEETNQPHGDSANDQGDEDFEKKSEKVHTSSDLAAKDDDALEEQTMIGDAMVAGSTVFVDNILDKSVESLEKDSNLPCEVGIDSAVNEEDVQKLRDSSSCEEEDFDDVKEKELYLVRDPEISQQKASYVDSASDQGDGDFEKKSEKVHTSSDLAAKDDDALEEQTMVGDGMVAGSTVFVGRIFDKSVESLEKVSNLPCDFGIDSAVNEEDAHELRDSSSCEEEDFDDVKEKELYLVRDPEISQQKESYDDSASDQGDGDFEKKSEKVHTSSNLAAKDDDALEEQTMVGDGMVAGSTVFVDNILDKTVESPEKDSNLEVSIDSAVNEEDAHELRESSSCEEENFNDVKEKELYLIRDLETSQQKASYGDSASDQEDGDFEKKSEKVHTSSDLAIKDDEALEEQTMAGDGMIAGSTVFVDNILDKSVEFLEKDSKLPYEIAIDFAVNEEDGHELRDSSSSEEDNFSDVKEKELYMIQDLEISYNEAEESGKCHSGEISVVNDGPQNHLSYISENASFSGTPVKKLEHRSSNISSCSGMNDSAVEERQETLLTDHCKDNLSESDASLKISGLIRGHKELCTPLKKTEFTSITNVSPRLGMDDFVTEESVELPELDTLLEMPEFTKGYLSPHLNSLFGEDTPLKSTGLTGSTNVTPSSGMDDSASEWSQEVCMKEDCNLGFPEIDGRSKMLELQKGHDESLLLGTLFGEGTPLKKCELIHTNVAPHSGMDDTTTEQSEVRPSTEAILHLVNSSDVSSSSGMDDSAIEQSEARPLTEACKSEPSEFEAPSKMFDCTEDNDFSFSPCLNIFDTPLKKPVLQSITGMPICSGMDDFAVEHNQEVHSTEACKLVHSEMFTPLKIPKLTKDNERPCLNTLVVEDIGMFSKKPEIESSTNMSHISGKLNVMKGHGISPFLKTVYLSGTGNSDIQQNSMILPKETSNLDNHDLKAPSEMPERVNDHDNSPCLNTLSEDIGTSLKNCEVTSNSEVSACSRVVDSVIDKVQEVLPTEASKNELSQIDDSSVEKCGEIFSTEICKLEMESLELNSPSKTFELTNNHDISPSLNTLFIDKIVTTLKNFEHTSNTGMSPCCGIDDSAAEHCRDVLPAEACKLDLSELNTPSEVPEPSIDAESSPCLKNLSVVITDTSLKTPMFTRGIDDSATEHSGDALSTEICKLDLSKLSTLSKMAELSDDHDRSPCLKTLFVDDIALLSETDDSTVDKNLDVLPTEECRQEFSELDSSSKMPKVTKDQDQSPCLNTSFLEDIGNFPKKTELTSSTHVNDSVLEQSQAILPLEVCEQECYEFDNPLKVSELTKDHSLSPRLNMLAGDFGDNSPCSGIKDFALEQNSNVLSTENCKLDLSKLSTPPKMAEDTEDHDKSPCFEAFSVDDALPLSEMDDSTANQNVDVLTTKDQDQSPCLNTLFLEDIGNLSKKTELTSSTHVNGSFIEQSQAVLPLQVCEQECYEFDNPSKVSELTKDHSLSPCLNMLAGDFSYHFPCSGIKHFAAEQSGDELSTEICKPDLSKLSTPPKMAELTEDHDISPCFEALFVDDAPLLSEMDDYNVDQNVDALPTEAWKQELSELDTSSKMPEVAKDQDRSPCLNTLFLEDIGNLSDTDDSTVDQSVDVLPTEACKQEFSELDTSSNMSEVTKDRDRSPCLNTLFLEDIGNLSDTDDSTVDQSVDVLPTEVCKQELSELDTSSNMSEVTKDQDRSPCLNTVVLEGNGNLSKKIELTSSTAYVQCSMVMNDSVLEQNQAVLPLEVCKQECYKFDTPLKASELSKDHSLSPYLNILAGDSGTALDMSTNSTDLSVCSGCADSDLHKMLEIHRTEDSNLQMALVRQSFSTPSERPKLADIDDLLQCVDIDNYAAEQDSEILPMEASKLECCQLDSQLKMGEPTEGHDNPGFQSRLAVESDLTKLSLGQLRRLYKDQMKQKESGKALSSNVFGEESSSFRKPEQSQQDCKTDLQSNNDESQVNTTLNEPQLAAESEKLDKPEEFGAGSNYVLHQTSSAEIRLPEMTSSYKISPCSGIEDSIMEQNQQACQTDLRFNNQQSSQVYTPLNKPELAEGCNRPAQLDKSEEFGAGSKYGLHQTSPVEIRLPEMTSNYKVSPCSGIDDSNMEQNQQACQKDLRFNNQQPSQVYTPLNKPELADGCNRPAQLDKPEEFGAGSKYVLHQTSPVEIRLPEMTSNYKVSPCSGIDDSIIDQNQQACQTDLCSSNQPSQDYTPLKKPELAEGCNRPAQLDKYSTSLKKSEGTGGRDFLCESPATEIITSETVFAGERKGLAFEEEPFLPNNSVESGLFVEYTVCKKTATSSKVESRIPSLADRLQILRDRLQTIQSNLQGQTPELSYATPFRKGINRKSIGSAKKSRVPMSVGRSNLAFEGARLASTKENSTDKTQLSLKRDQRSYKENQMKPKDSEKVVGKRPALQNLSLNVLEQRVDFLGQSLPPDNRVLHIHEEDCN